MLKLGNSFFSIVTGFAFAAAALLHGWRAYAGFDLMYGDWLVPLWLSWLVCLVAFLLSLAALMRLR